MSDKRDCNSPNVFSPAFLDALRRREDEALAVTEAEARGPWKVVDLCADVASDSPPESTERWAVFRQWEKPGRHTPAGVFRYREHALLYAAALTLTARGANVSVGLTRDEDGQVVSEFAAESGLKTVGHTAWFAEDAVAGFRLLDGLLRNADALAWVMDAGGVTLAELVGDLLAAEYLAGKEGAEE